MPCPKCSDSKTPFCGSCGERVLAFAKCPWCEFINAAENLFCGSCGKKIAFEPFPYSKKATTRDTMVEEVLKENTKLDEKGIKRFISNMDFHNDCQCTVCGEICEVAGAKRRDLFGFFSLKNLGVIVLDSVVEVFNEETNNYDDPVEKIGDRLERELFRICLVCGNAW